MGDTLGQKISEARKSKGLSQKQLAAEIRRDDGTPISPQYLNDIEHDRRKPSSDYLVQQFATLLGVDPDYLYYLADRFPEDLRDGRLSPKDVSDVMRAFRKSSSKKGS